MSENPPPPAVPVSPLPYHVDARRWDNYVIALGVLAVVIGGIALGIGVLTMPSIFNQIIPAGTAEPLRFIDFVLNWMPIRELFVFAGGCALLWRSRFTWHVTVAYVALGLVRPIIMLAVLPWTIQQMRAVATTLSGTLMLHSYASAAAYGVALLAALFLLFHPSVRAVFDAWASERRHMVKG